LLEMIRAEREKDPAVGYLDHLRAALDYRNWHRFSVQVVDDAKPGVKRALHGRLGLSQGEQRVVSYLALFAAAAAYYEGIGAGCPRLLLLDDAFAKVDEPTHGRLLRLLIDLDLDFMITSERMWGCFREVPSLEIYEALREPAVPGVALVHFGWDGAERHLVGL
ncbi:MAG TPA: SbcC/MukB-like Walker B domain-containing protein, partial [Acidimicrobiales bacterium]|nr:SbcC/MukB-like Walker B domain-containing protein [Acidimicrobiales bacterium]